MTKVARKLWVCDVLWSNFQKLNKECTACGLNWFCEILNGSKNTCKDCVGKSVVIPEVSKGCGECWN